MPILMIHIEEGQCELEDHSDDQTILTGDHLTEKYSHSFLVRKHSDFYAGVSISRRVSAPIMRLLQDICVGVQFVCLDCDVS